MKTAKDFMAEANAVVARLSFEEASELHASGNAVFVDVRDSGLIAKSGTIEGALCIPRGMMEFAADPGTPFHNAALQKDAQIALVCGAGGQAALAGKTLVDMGFQNVVNVGGFGDWKEAGGKCQPG